MERPDSLVDGVAHALNNMLCIIKMAADDVSNESFMSALGRESIDDIFAMVERGTLLSQQLLIIGGCSNFQLRVLDLNALIAEKVEFMNTLFDDRFGLQVLCASEPVFLYADADMMDQMFLHLIQNARDAMADGGKVVVKVAAVEFDELAASKLAHARAGVFTSFSVADTGCGVPPEMLDKIFAPFFTTKGSGKNSGLGLATVSRIVSQHQGWINVDSEVGRGTTFRVYIPRFLGSQTPSLERSPAT